MVASSQVHCLRSGLRLREMPKPTETDLALANRHVAEERIIIARQRDRIARLKVFDPRSRADAEPI
jgi:hypothetical protein